MADYCYENFQAFIMDIEHDKHVEIASLQQSSMSNYAINAANKVV